MMNIPRHTAVSVADESTIPVPIKPKNGVNKGKQHRPQPTRARPIPLNKGVLLFINDTQFVGGDNS